MASDKAYLRFVLEQLSETENITYRAMMGEFILYCRGRVFGGIYDNRFLVKDIAAARACLPDAAAEVPYPGGRAMLSVDCIDDREALARLVGAMYPELPESRRKG